MSDSQSASANSAVFLSYASQDAESARRICEALRTAGVEVWFDQSELVGGDAWDAKIRGQIGSCALFVPLISANTQARLEGYFRLEWKLAVNRTQTMAEERAFLLPVVIDGTRDAEAKVPVEFKAVQWTRLPAGEGADKFCARVRSLLGGPTVAGIGDPGPASPRPATAGHRAHRAGWLAAAALILVAAVGVFLWLRRPAAEPAQESRQDTAATLPAPTPAAPQPDSKSIAVLPFANMNDDKESGYFADGVHEDILTGLVGVRDLRVVSRTSVMEYRGTTKKIGQIGRELHVAFVLEGSVRRSGNRVRVTGQLIRTATDEHVWAKNYDRDLTDIFTIQAELAQAISAELGAVLSPQEQKRIAAIPTSNPAAYDLYLRTREIADLGTGIVHEDIAKWVSLAEGAVALDPKFAEAWASLAEAHVVANATSMDTSPARLAKARDALDRGQAIAPNSPVVQRVRGKYYLFGDGDGVKAIEQFERILAQRPNDVDCLLQLEVAQRLSGRWTDAIGTMRTCIKLEPGNERHVSTLAWLLAAGRRYAEAKIELRRLKPSDETELWSCGLTWYATGSRRELEAFLAQLEAREPDSPLLREEKMRRALIRADHAEYDRLLATLPASGGFDEEVSQAMRQAWAMKRRGDLAGARKRLGDLPNTLRARLDLEPENTRWMRGLAASAAIQGDYTGALQFINRAAALNPNGKNSPRAFAIRKIRAEIYADMGDRARAVEQLNELLGYPSTEFNVHTLAEDPRFATLRGDPGFEAMLRDPKNNAPLF
jgi:TolB-like protein/Flp pilus assembly protein TadD